MTEGRLADRENGAPTKRSCERYDRCALTLLGPLPRIRSLPAVGVAQLVRAPDCDSGGRGFNSRRPPHESPVSKAAANQWRSPLSIRHWVAIAAIGWTAPASDRNADGRASGFPRPDSIALHTRSRPHYAPSRPPAALTGSSRNHRKWLILKSYRNPVAPRVWPGAEPVRPATATRWALKLASWSGRSALTHRL